MLLFDDDYPSIVVYESGDKKSLDVSISQYISVEGHELYAFVGKNRALVVNKDNRDKILHEYPGIKLQETQNKQPELENNDADILECSIFMSSYVWDYLYEDGETLKVLVPSVKSMIIDTYRDLKTIF